MTLLRRIAFKVEVVNKVHLLCAIEIIVSLKTRHPIESSALDVPGLEWQVAGDCAASGGELWIKNERILRANRARGRTVAPLEHDDMDGRGLSGHRF